MRILVLDDQAFFNAYLAAVSSEVFQSAEVISVDTVAAARIELRHEPCDLLILDILLPDGDGFDFAEEATQEHPQLKIVGITADCTHFCVHRLARSSLRVFVDENS